MALIDTKLKRMPRTTRVGVVAGGLSEFITIQAAIDWCNTQAVPAPSAAAPYTVEIWPGVYDEVITTAPYVYLEGIGPPGSVVIQQDDATIVNLIDVNEIENVTFRLVTPTGAIDMLTCGDVHTTVLRHVRFEVTTPGAFAIAQVHITTASTLTMAYCEGTIGGTGASLTVRNTNAAATIHLWSNDFTHNNVNAFHIQSTVAGTWTGGGNRWAGTCGLFSVTLGTITLDGDQHVCTAVNVVAAAATVLMREGFTTYHVWPGMDIQDALTAGAAGEIVIHAGAHAPIADLTVAADTLVTGEGKATIITPTGAAITNGMILNGNNIHVKDLKIILAAGAGGAGTRPNVIYADTRNLLWLENLWIVGDTSVADDASEVRQCGIFFVTCTECKVVDCRTEDNRRYGLHLATGANNNTVTGNTVQGSLSYGIYLSGNSFHNTLTGNTSQGNVSGITLIQSGNTTITGNTCQGNTQGIQLSSAGNTTVTGNTCQGNSLYGIWVYDSPGTTVTGNTCSGNTTHGIYLQRTSYCVVTGNTCSNQTNGDGINVTGDATINSDYNTLTGNACTGNGDDGIEIAGGAFANKNIVLGNQLLGNAGLALNEAGVFTNVGHNITI